MDIGALRSSNLMSFMLLFLNGRSTDLSLRPEIASRASAKSVGTPPTRRLADLGA